MKVTIEVKCEPAPTPPTKKVSDHMHWAVLFGDESGIIGIFRGRDWAESFMTHIKKEMMSYEYTPAKLRKIESIE